MYIHSHYYIRIHKGKLGRQVDGEGGVKEVYATVARRWLVVLRIVLPVSKTKREWMLNVCVLAYAFLRLVYFDSCCVVYE